MPVDRSARARIVGITADYELGSRAAGFSPVSSDTVPPVPVAIAHNTAPYVTVFDQNTWEQLAPPAEPPTGNARGVAFSPDGQTLAVGYFAPPYLSVYDWQDSAWVKRPDPATGPGERVFDVAFSPDGSVLACAVFGADNIALYNTADMTRLPNPATLPGTDGRSVAFNPDGSRLVVTSAGSPYYRIYDTSDWSIAATVDTFTAGVARGCCFSKDGALLVILTDAPAVQIFETTGWTRVATPTVPSTLRLYSPRFSPDDQTLAVGRSSGNTLSLYDRGNNWALTEIAAGFSEVFAQDYSPDGEYILLCQSDAALYTTDPYEDSGLLDFSLFCFAVAFSNIELGG